MDTMSGVEWMTFQGPGIPKFISTCPMGTMITKP